ncbi:adenylate kinase [Rhodococcus sp. IEGM 1307]|jgi:adenylate kinase|uniref:adenylate kinase n=1 Tax=Rhodococcus sp. IEGM 1307 TaxID=3047091 RepID=UPI0024B6FD08|nr:adenylate kinase [Rhodococcus sp. IEGM 1307]MDI9978877.1 adenylate kinase [Rhodococcus sp. IEGM 1307]
MKLVLLGPPGAGKGTQAKLLSEKLDVPHISTGDLFRANIAEATALGIRTRSYLDAGELVPSDLTVQMVQHRLSESDSSEGFLLDGFPRTLEQAEALSVILAARGEKLDKVLSFVVAGDVLTGRMLARGRADDMEEVIANRLRVYEAETAPLLNHYADQIVPIDAVGEVDEVHHRVLDALGR